MTNALEAAFREEVAKHDWSALRSFLGNATSVPDALRALVFAETEGEALHAYRRVDGVVLVQGRLSQASTAAAAVLVRVLGEVREPARGSVLDLLAEIAAGYAEHIDDIMVGPVDEPALLGEVVKGFPLYRALLLAEGNASCVDLVLSCASFDEFHRKEAREIYRKVLESAAFAEIHELVANSLADIG